MNKSELVKQLAEKTQISMDEADIMVQTMVDEMKKQAEKDAKAKTDKIAFKENL